MSSGFFVQPFLRRVGNGEVGSICTKCYRTISTVPSAALADEAENSHQCNGLNLESLFYPESPAHPLRSQRP